MEPALQRLTTALSDRYRIERELGAGGMATVYLAEDLRHDRKVAIKVLRPELAAVIGAERFLKEIKTTANLQHPHILGLIDSGNSDSFLWYAMPFVDGESLRDRLTRDKQLPIADAVRIATEVAGALDYANRHGVIHRDIKPENILLHDGSALVADFGIALAASTAGTRMTETGMSLGTPHYMSPEQAMGEREITARSDVYALGCVLYEMLVGDPPFTGSTAQAIVAKVVTEKPAPPSRIRDTVPPAVEDAVLTALEKLPADRFATAAEFAAALAGGATIRSATRPIRPTEGHAYRRRAMAVAVITLAAFCIAGGWLLGRRGGGSAGGGPASYDAVVPDSALITFAASTLNVSYGTAMRNISVSAAGDFVVYAAKQGDSTALWYRSLRNADAHSIAGTVGGTAPRISPDGQWVAFFLGDQIMVVPIGGGSARRLFEGKQPSWLAWTPTGQLLASDADGNRLSWLDPAGGAPRTKAITRCGFGGVWVESLHQLLCSFNRVGVVVDPESGEQWTIRAAAPDGRTGKVVAGSAFQLVDDRYLIYLAADGALVAAKYDPANHTAGKAVLLLPGVRREAVGEGQYDLATNGSLVYAPGVDAAIGRVVRLLPGKQPQPLPMEAADFQRYDLSRDGRWLAAVVQGPIENELRQYDLRNGQNLTWLRSEYLRHPLWDPTGDKLLIGVREGSRYALLLGAPSSGVRPDTIVSGTDKGTIFDATDFHDDHLAIAQDWIASNVFRFDPSLRQAKMDTVLTGARFASLSPSGKLILYATLEGNRVVVTSFPSPSRRWQVASEGSEPIWLSASEVLYRLGVSWFIVHINPDTGEPLGPGTLWGRDPRFSDTPGWSNRPSHDGGIIYIQGPAQVTGNHFRVIPNWVSQMKSAVDKSGNPR